ncbi:MAG: 50S ribosomal protein L30 [Desulfomonilia bacterium]|uniref:50S ribosomal subunit protein L30 n=1 Tax=anaerobic digester metagenome TaxID=1263854 RepID=A0A485LWR6_9ZZZZ|nr:50S ribosomal protein L30 [Pseudomonadota bacterium]HON39589.1 50S ribosomal protein L30 [Deltaproteobacteria bacterium]HRS57257.1 50S ribosomal protein L30 [Desulfomonilia bacterium]HPD22302.1 50S ribosomal protein L30 [Deltaproteobacteria bacterium]HPX19313.1 50S ribosomal protein L30 [Deltaproteobacteria bacterium]
MGDKIKITLSRSVIGGTKGQRETVKALGLKRRGRSVILPDNAATRGAIRKVSHLLSWEEL